MSDVGLSVAIGLVMVVLSLLGVSSSKRWHKVVAGLLGLAGVLLIGWQAVRNQQVAARNAQVQDELLKRIQEIQKITSQPPRVVVQQVMPKPRGG
jgi:threonine/homoserine/homoserine lactone efflux protein